MKIKVELEITRDDGSAAIKDEKKDEIMDELEQELGNISLTELTLNEGRANETTVALNISVSSIEQVK